MLVSLNISQWTARKHDKSVSNEVDKAHNAKDAGRYNKLLIRKEALEPMEQIAAAARQHLYKVTFPWGDNGDRLLPAALFLEFAQTMQQFRNEFDTRVRAFATEYPTLVQEARVRLGTLYDPNDYPTDVRSKFVFNPVSVTPVPSASDFRVDLGQEQVEQIRAEITSRMEERQAGTRKECWTRLRTHVSKLSERLSDPKAKLFDSLVTNPQEFLEILPAMNLTGDQALAKAADELKQILVPVDRLRQDKRLRADIAARASEMLTRMP
jgi:hypothetical protein